MRGVLEKTKVFGLYEYFKQMASRKEFAVRLFFFAYT